jgi:hypothetical protein
LYLLHGDGAFTDDAVGGDIKVPLITEEEAAAGCEWHCYNGMCNHRWSLRTLTVVAVDLR